MRVQSNVLLVLVLTLSLMACMGTWEKHPTFERRASAAMLIASDAAIVCDLSQTLWMANRGRYDRGLTELNPVLGRTPSPARIVATNIVALGANTAAYFLLPKRWRPYYYLVTLVEVANVLTQPSAGDTARFGEHKGCDFQQNWGSQPPPIETARQ
jgi:hypothetical protein